MSTAVHDKLSDILDRHEKVAARHAGRMALLGVIFGAALASSVWLMGLRIGGLI